MTHVNKDELTLRAKRLYEDGSSFRQIGETLGVARKTAARWVQTRTVSAEPLADVVRTDDNTFLIRRAKKLRADGLTFKAIGQSLGVSGATAARWVRS